MSRETERQEVRNIIEKLMKLAFGDSRSNLTKSELTEGDMYLIRQAINVDQAETLLASFEEHTHEEITRIQEQRRVHDAKLAKSNEIDTIYNELKKKTKEAGVPTAHITHKRNSFRSDVWNDGVRFMKVAGYGRANYRNPYNDKIKITVRLAFPHGGRRIGLDRKPMVDEWLVKAEKMADDLLKVLEDYDYEVLEYRYDYSKSYIDVKGRKQH